jgi:hypothetical protein
MDMREGGRKKEECQLHTIHCTYMQAMVYYDGILLIMSFFYWMEADRPTLVDPDRSGQTISARQPLDFRIPTLSGNFEPVGTARVGPRAHLSNNSAPTQQTFQQPHASMCHVQ